MAQVPYQPVPTVEPSVNGSGATYGNVPEANANAFGAQIGTALQGAGQDVDKLADHFTNIYLESTARDASTQAATQLSDLEAKFHQLKGNDAVAGLKDFQKNSQAIVENISGNLSPNAANMFKRDAAGLVNNAIYRAGSHAGEQADNAQKESLNASIATNVNQFAMNATNPTGATYLQKIQDDALSYAHFNGITDPNVADQLVSHNYGEAFSAAIRTNLQSNPDAAQKLWDQAQNGSITKPDGSTVPFLDAAHRASISAEMQGEFRRQALTTISDAKDYASTGDDYNKSAVTGSMLRAGYKQDDVNAMLHHLDNVQSSFGTANARYDVGKALDNDAALAYAGKAPVGVYDEATLHKAYPKDPDKVTDILNEVNQLHQVAGFVGGMSTRTPAENQAELDKLKPTSGMSVADSIHMQESGGKDTAPANGISVGGWQITPDTFKQYAKEGENINNSKDNEAVGRRIIDDLSQKFGGDPARIAVGYFSGPGNVAPAGSPTPWVADKKDANGKSVSSYVSDVVGRMGGANFGAQSALHDKMQQAAQAYYKQFYADPAGTLTGNNNLLNTLYEAGAKDSTKMNSYIDAVSTQQEALQVPEANRSVLPKSYATQVTNNLMANPESAPEQLSKMATTYGNNWPKVYQSLVQQGGLPPAYQVVQQLGSDPENAKYGTMLAKYLGSDETKNKDDALLMGGESNLKTLKTSVAQDQRMTALTASLSRSGASPQQISDTVATTQKLAMAIHFYNPTDGNPSETAIKALTSKFAYLPDGGARVPADKFETISQNAEHIRANIDKIMSPQQFVPPTYADRQHYIDDVRSEPMWVTRGSENMVYLYDHFNKPVLGTNGKQISIGFNDPPPPEARELWGTDQGM